MGPTLDPSLSTLQLWVTNGGRAESFLEATEGGFLKGTR